METVRFYIGTNDCLFIKKILEIREKKSFLEIMDEVGPIIKYDNKGRKVFVFNPFYRGKDL